MLPNWLYGKSKSKLASILGGGGGTPEDYNQVKAQVTQNTEDILQLSDALDDKAALTQITNPNILHNPWFQVNQRGVSSATANGYFVDRWRLVCAATGATTFTLNSDGTITIDNSLGEAQAYFVQRRTAKTISRVTGRKITASVMLSDDSVRSGTGTYVDTETTNYYEDDDIKIQSIAQSYGQFFVLRVEAGKSITIRALKLEVGEVSTLAMDPCPEYAIELAKCQRYFQRIGVGASNIWLAMGNGYNGNAIFVIPIAPMRANPTLTYANVTLASVQTTSVAIASKTGERYDANRTRCHLTLTYDQASFTETELPLGIYASANSGGYLDFDAEL